MASFACGTRDEPYMPPPGQTPCCWSAACHGGTRNIYKLKATLCGLLCLRKVCPGILVWNGMQFPLGTRLGKWGPLWGLILGRGFRLTLIGKVRPGLGAQTGMDFPDEGLTENVSRSGR